MTAPRDETILKNIGVRIAQARKARGLTQQQVAEKIEASVVAVAYIETGKRWPRLGTLTSIAQVLQVDLQEFFIGVDEPAKASGRKYKLSDQEQ